ncbi:Hsp70 family protein [bacterium]|nr:Hsp70 family protein [bacterium]
MSRRIVGIDFGTTNSLVAVMGEDGPELLPNSRDTFLTPSVVGVSETGDLLVGESAKNQSVAFPNRTVSSIKRLLGETAEIVLGKETFSPQELAGAIIKRLKLDAEEALGEIVEEAVITVPAYFSDAQRQAVKDAGEVAGFVVERILNEPTAAALAYGYSMDEAATLLVYDFGGGTFDVSVIKTRDGAFRVLATSGNATLGGDDIDWKIVAWIEAKFQEKEGIDLQDEEIDDIQRRVTLQRLKDAAERAKIDLSDHLETTINLPFIYTESEEPKHIKESLSRKDLEAIVLPFCEMTRGPVEQAVKDSGIPLAKLTDVILVGGTTLIPRVQAFVEEITGMKVKHTVDPEEAVALGAAIQAGVKTGALDEMVIVDIAPHSLGIEVRDSRFSAIIPRNTAIPCSKKKPYVTTEDNQTEAQITVYQGEEEVAASNSKLGDFIFAGIDPQPAGKSLIDVQFDYDINGLVKVTATDRINKTEKSVVFKTSSVRMSQEEVRESQLEIGIRTSRDTDSKEAVEANALAFETEAFIRDRRKFLPVGTMESLHAAIIRVRRAMETLPEGQGIVMALRHYQGLSIKEIAEVRQCAVGTVKSALFQAFRNLQKAVRSELKRERDASA